MPHPDGLIVFIRWRQCHLHLANNATFGQRDSMS